LLGSSIKSEQATSSVSVCPCALDGRARLHAASCAACCKTHPLGLNKGLLWSRGVAACAERLWQVPVMAWHPKIHTSLCLEALSHHQQLYVPSLRSVCPAGIGSEVWTPVVIGEFPEEDARAFLEVLLKERTALLNDSTWSKVYNVSHSSRGCGVCVARGSTRADHRFICGTAACLQQDDVRRLGKGSSASWMRPPASLEYPTCAQPAVCSLRSFHPSCRAGLRRQRASLGAAGREGPEYI